MRCCRRVARDLSEDDTAIDVIEVNSDEVGLLSEGLGDMDHPFEGVGAGRLVISTWKGQLRVEGGPIRKKEVDPMIAEAVRVDLDEADPTVKNEKLVVPWDLPVGVQQQLFDQDLWWDVAVRPLQRDIGVVKRQPCTTCRNE